MFITVRDERGFRRIIDTTFITALCEYTGNIYVVFLSSGHSFNVSEESFNKLLKEFKDEIED